MLVFICFMRILIVMLVMLLLSKHTHVLNIFYFGFWIYLIVNLSQIYKWGNSIHKHIQTMNKENQAIVKIQLLCKSDNDLKQDLSLVTDVCNKNISNMYKDYPTMVTHALNVSWPLLPFLFKTIITYWYVIPGSMLLYSILYSCLQPNLNKNHINSKYSV